LVLTPALREAAIQNMWHGLWKENEMDAYLGHLLAAVKIFEQVEGAKVEGRAPAGSTVVLQIPLRLRTSGRAWLYRQSSRADATGRFQLTIPYSTELAPGTDLEPTGQASLTVEGPPAKTDGGPAPENVVLTIPETAVQNGDRVNWRGWLGQP
jgi:asparagine N-glycosylation enzyme membrane subunit Stt3